MAHILLCFHADLLYTEYKDDTLVSFYDSLTQELQKHGNKVLVYNSDFLCSQRTENDIQKNIKPAVRQKIKQFDPDLIISFNHILPSNVEDYTHCPIILWSADDPWYWTEKEKAFKSPYIFVTNGEKVTLELKEYGIQNVHQLPLATSVQAEKMDPLYNISFIGTLYPHYLITDVIKKNQELREDFKHLLISFTQKNNYSMESLLQSTGSEHLAPAIGSEEAFYFLLDLRVTLLASLLELGVEIFGPPTWDTFSLYYWNFLYASLNPKRVYSLKHNQDIFNSSKLSLNHAHPQVGMSRVSWRVYDILASNACILSQKNTKLKELLKPYIDIPMFESPSEAFSLAKKLLDSPSWRSEIVSASQSFIEDQGRWDDNIKTLEQISGVKLTGGQASQASPEFITRNSVLPAYAPALNTVMKRLLAYDKNTVPILSKIFRKVVWKEAHFLWDKGILNLDNCRKIRG